MPTTSPTSDPPPLYDAIIIGGGPAGSITAMSLAKKGRKVVVIEKTPFPRFHIGESFLPATFDRLKELGLDTVIKKLPHVPKFGAQFAMGYGGKLLDIDFCDGFCPCDETFNIERSLFDAALLDEAKKAGAEVRQPLSVKQILSLADGDVRVLTDDGELRARWLLDASGQGTVVGRHFGTRVTTQEPHLRKIAYFNQFENVQRPPGKKEGHPLIAMMEEGWFWLIPLNEKKTSIGMVLDADAAKTIQRDRNLPPDKMLQWGIANCPIVQERMREAKGPDTNMVAADFSYTCPPYAGEGYFLVGDSAAFQDPIFSTGVSVAVNSAIHVSQYVDDILAGRISPARARKKYTSHLKKSTGTLFQLIRQYYDHSFRELFLVGTGPIQIHKAVIGVLAGNVFPRPPFKLRWRLQLFDYLVKLNRKKRLVVRRRRFSMLKAAAEAAKSSLAGSPAPS